MKMCPSKIIGVTGSDGKTTTTSLINAILQGSGYKTFLGGNIGTPLFTKLDEMQPDDIVVLELSSFQLMGMEVSPNISVITNITPNHLNIHKDYEEYIDAKKNIFKYQNENDIVVLNYDNEITRACAKEAKGKVIFFSDKEKLDNGYIIDEDIIKICTDKIRKHLLNVNDVILRGKHNYENIATALAATSTLVDIDKAIEDAYLVGRKDNIFFNNYDILYTLLCKKNINVDMTLNEEVAKQNIEDIGVNLPGVVVESSYSVEDDELIITKGKAGVKIDTEKLLNEIKERLNDVNLKEKIIEIPVLNKEPESIDIDKIHEEIYTEAKDAYYTKNPFAVYPEVEGIDFDVEEAKALLEEEKEEYVIKLKITKPKVTISQIGSEAFPDQLATFTTRFDVSDVDRSTNLKIACQKINGKVILSGDTFSYNKALGARTAAAGYKNGKIYSGGQVVDGIGGGICQISSTLYNSVLLADLEIVERRNHQFVTSYVGPGRDATVVYGLTDFKFKNTRQYPVRISASAQNGIATISIYGIKEENEYTFKFSTKTVATIPFSVRYVEDESLDVGTEKVKQKGTNGLKTETYITKMLNGKVISTKLLSRDTYDAMERIIIKGTKSANNKTINVTEGTTESVESSTNTTEEKRPETTPSGNKTTTETNTTPTTESKE